MWEALVFSSVSVTVAASLLLPLVELSRLTTVGWAHFTAEIEARASEAAVTISALEDDLHLFDPLCMWLSQYFCWGIASLLHRHLLPSVLLHLCVSSAVTLWCLYTWKLLTASVTSKKLYGNLYSYHIFHQVKKCLIQTTILASYRPLALLQTLY